MFSGLNFRYEWSLPAPVPGEKLSVNGVSFRSHLPAPEPCVGSQPIQRRPLDSGGEKVFVAGMILYPKPLNAWQSRFLVATNFLRLRLLSAPLMTAAVVLWIHLQAGKVWWKGKKQYKISKISTTSGQFSQPKR